MHHLGVEIPVLSVTPVPEASQDNGLLFLCPKQKQVQCRSWKDKPQAGEHPSQPKARERCNMLVGRKLSRVSVSDKRRCTHLRMSDMPNLPDGDTRTVNNGHRALLLSESQASGLVATSPGHRVRRQRPQQIHWR